jgi:hypothetical protein
MTLQVVGGINQLNTSTQANAYQLNQLNTSTQVNTYQLNQLNASAQANEDQLNKLNLLAQANAYQLQSSMASLQLELQRSNSLFAAVTASIRDQIGSSGTAGTSSRLEAAYIPPAHSLMASAAGRTPENVLHSRPLSKPVAAPTYHPMWVVRSAVIFQESRGKLQVEMKAIRDKDFCNLSAKDQAVVASKLLRLRLLLWLFQRESYVVSIQIQTLSRRLAQQQSSFVAEASMTATWTFQKALEGAALFGSKLAAERKANEYSYYRALPSDSYAPYLVYLTTRVADSRDLTQLRYFAQILDPVFAHATRFQERCRSYLHFRDVRESLRTSRISVLDGLNRDFMLTLLQECPEGFGWLTGRRKYSNDTDEDVLKDSIELVTEIISRYNFVLKQQLRLKGIEIGSDKAYRPTNSITKPRIPLFDGGGVGGGLRWKNEDGENDDDDEDQMWGF